MHSCLDTKSIDDDLHHSEHRSPGMAAVLWGLGHCHGVSWCSCTHSTLGRHWQTKKVKEKIYNVEFRTYITGHRISQTRTLRDEYPIVVMMPVVWAVVNTWLIKETKTFLSLWLHVKVNGAIWSLFHWW